MSAPTVRQVREGIATLLDTITGLRVFSHIPGQFAPPAAVVGMPSLDFDSSMGRGLDEWSCDVWVVVAHQSDKHAEKNLESYLDPTGSKSVKAKLESDGTLSGTVSDSRVTFAEPVEFVFGDVTYIGLQFTLQIFAEGA